MNNKGLTLIELIVTFVLAAAIIVILFNVLILIKNNYEDTDVKTKLVVNQSTLSNLMNDMFKSGNLDSYTTCTGEFCYEFTFKDESVVTLSVSSKKITFGNYTYNLDDITEVVSPSLTINNPYLIIKIPVKTKMYPDEDFGINLVYKIEE